MRRAPDRSRALELYRRHARRYDRSGWVTRRLRSRAVSLLDLSQSDTVMDVGCGTGLSLSLLRSAVGEEGRVIGVELSPDMAAVANERIDRRGWDNVEVLNSPAEELELNGPVDGVLFFLTHDVMRSPTALEHTLDRVRSGGSVVAFGAKLPPVWAFPLIPLVWLVSRRYITTYDGARKPWSHLETRIADLQVQAAVLGCTYFAWGTKT